MPLGKEDDGLAGDMHGPELLGLVGGSGVAEVIEGFQAAGDALLKIAHAAGVDGAVKSGMAGGPLLHEFGEQAGFVGSPATPAAPG